MGLNPVLDYIVLKVIDAPVAPGKLHVVNVDPTAPKYAKVVAVGIGRPSEYSGRTILYPPVGRPGADGKESPVNVGDTVLLHGGAGTKVKESGGEETLWILPRDLMAVVSE